MFLGNSSLKHSKENTLDVMKKPVGKQSMHCLGMFRNPNHGTFGGQDAGITVGNKPGIVKPALRSGGQSTQILPSSIFYRYYFYRAPF